MHIVVNYLIIPDALRINPVEYYNSGQMPSPVLCSNTDPNVFGRLLPKGCSSISQIHGAEIAKEPHFLRSGRSMANLIMIFSDISTFIETRKMLNLALTALKVLSDKK
ncbi:hypothetical protein ACQZ6V_15075 [Agrobacterium sp. 22-3674b3]